MTIHTFVETRAMRINFTEKRIKLLRTAIALVATSVAATVAYAATPLTIQNNSSVSIRVTNLFAVTGGVTGTTNCATASGYADIGLSITWALLPQGAALNANICLKNTGASSDTLNFLTTQLPTGVTFSTNSQGALLSGRSFLNAQLTLAASSTAMIGGFSFALTIW